jgi:hypothetical protein
MTADSRLQDYVTQFKSVILDASPILPADAIFYFREGLQDDLKIECLTTAIGAEFTDLDSLITHAFVQDQKLQCKHTVQSQKTHRQLAALQGPSQKKPKVMGNPNGNYKGTNFIKGYIHSRQPGPLGFAAPAAPSHFSALAAAPYGPHAPAFAAARQAGQRACAKVGRAKSSRQQHAAKSAHLCQGCGGQFLPVRHDYEGCPRNPVNKGMRLDAVPTEELDTADMMVIG